MDNSEWSNFVLEGTVLLVATISMIVAILQLHIVHRLENNWRDEENKRLNHQSVRELAETYMDFLIICDSFLQLVQRYLDNRSRIYTENEIQDVKNGMKKVQELYNLVNKKTQGHKVLFGDPNGNLNFASNCASKLFAKIKGLHKNIRFITVELKGVKRTGLLYSPQLARQFNESTRLYDSVHDTVISKLKSEFS